MNVRTALMILGVSLSPSAGASQADADTVRACMQANVPGAARVNSFEMKTQAGDATETLGGTLYLHRDDQRRALTLQIDRPSHLDGSAFLFVERDQGEQMFVYLSAMGRVRQITGAAMEGQFFGSALRYSDIRQAMGMIAETAGTRLADVEYDAAPAHALALKGGDSQSVVTLLVDPKRCVPLSMRVERDGRLQREFNGLRKDMVEDQGRWYLRRATMHDHERKAKTEIVLGELRGFDEIPMIVFSRTDFHRARFAKR